MEGKAERKALDPVWPDADLEKQMLHDAYLVGQAASGHFLDANAECHVKALLCRVRELERALKATGYFQQRTGLPAPWGHPGGHDYHAAWLEAVQYTEDVDALLDGFDVPTRKDGRTLWLRDRVELLATAAARRSRLAYRLFQEFDRGLGGLVASGNYPALKELRDDARKEFGIAT
jgi:hypothetical protein